MCQIKCVSCCCGGWMGTTRPPANGKGRRLSPLTGGGGAAWAVGPWLDTPPSMAKFPWPGLPSRERGTSRCTHSKMKHQHIRGDGAFGVHSPGVANCRSGSFAHEINRSHLTPPMKFASAPTWSAPLTEAAKPPWAPRHLFSQMRIGWVQ